ncbi:MAG TPA: hypothetical protein VFV50_03610 [Bdellovibrionales bacterium]|nr:hypothetical protein [Bdellovibrionales bacterium]
MHFKSYLIASSISVFLIGVMTQFTNCAPADVEFKQAALEAPDFTPLPPDSDLLDGLEPPERVAVLCAQGATTETVTTISFPRPTETCPWNQNGNLQIRNGYFQGRIEQSQAFTLPPQSTLCSLSFDFPEQQFLFDDHFILALNGIVLASSYNYAPMLEKMNNLPVYNWSRIAGTEWITAKEGTYCSGLGSECAWPSTDVPGAIRMKFTPALIQSITALDLNRMQHRFDMITIGDNDDADCEHAPIQFRVRAVYAR